MCILLQQDLASNDPAGADAAPAGDPTTSPPTARHHSLHHTLTDAGQSHVLVYVNPLLNSSLPTYYIDGVHLYH